MRSVEIYENQQKFEIRGTPFRDAHGELDTNASTLHSSDSIRT